ncbi:MAG: VOC family protein [Chitinophagales bacterium]
MKQLLHFITIGVKDLNKMKSFYKECFGWKPMRDEDGIVFYKLNGFILSLYPEHELAEDIGIKNDGSGFKKTTFAICFNSEQEVDKIFEQLKTRGVEIIKHPQKVFWGGYSGYVADIENNYWELAYNPFLKFEENGNVAGG